MLWSNLSHQVLYCFFIFTERINNDCIMNDRVKIIANV